MVWTMVLSIVDICDGMDRESSSLVVEVVVVGGERDLSSPPPRLTASRNDVDVLLLSGCREPGIMASGSTPLEYRGCVR